MRTGSLFLQALAMGIIATAVVAAAAATAAEGQVLDSALHHLRGDGPREWTEFPETPEADQWQWTFEAEENADEQTLSIRQQDVKQAWNVELNGTRIGQLVRDENDMRVYYAVAAGTLKTGQNQLRIFQPGSGANQPDDIRVGEVTIDARPMAGVLGECTVRIKVFDSETRKGLPARVTIVDHEGVLQTVNAALSERLAVRPGTVYTADGQAVFSLPAGAYTIYAGRGFEYSLASCQVRLAAGETAERELTIFREVPTEGYVACDTHVHTLTHSGHGDATVQERMITLAAEGIELAVATDHNVHVDHDPYAKSAGLRDYFTPVIGNEVTTGVGHFNIFPVQRDAAPPDHQLGDWPSIFRAIRATPGVEIIILNHARDLHRGVRPFGPKRYNALVGEIRNGWPIGFDGMEVVNSSAVQTDPMRLFEDWMLLLNRGVNVTPVGGSDSHDVARHFVGQGRTYIACDDSRPGQIDIRQAVESFRAGRVMVSYGLLVELEVGGAAPGELAAVDSEEVDVRARVLGPHWIRADRLQVYVNGRRWVSEDIRSEAAARPAPGVIWQGGWKLPRPVHDVHIVAIADGPGILAPYWRTAKPYQPKSPDWDPRVIGASGAVWVDGDQDGRRTSAREYARHCVAQAGDDLEKLIAILADYDHAVAAHAAFLLTQQGQSPLSAEWDAALEEAAEATRTGFAAFRQAWREGELAQARPTE